MTKSKHLYLFAPFPWALSAINLLRKFFLDTKASLKFRIDIRLIYPSNSAPSSAHKNHMKRIAIVALSLLFALRASAITFNFTFDNDPTTGLQPPIVGTGSFSFANDPGNGTFAFNSLGAFSMAFSFIDGEAFTGADIVSDLNQVLVILSMSGTNRRLQFSDTGSGGGGPFGGSLDFTNSTGLLSFEPSYFGGNLDLYFSNAFFGSYLATTGNAAVPDASSAGTLMFLALVALVGLHRLLSSRLAAPLRS
jgi:hypothetical protein